MKKAVLKSLMLIAFISTISGCDEDTVLRNETDSLPTIKKMSISKTDLLFDYFIDTTSFYIKNIGNEDFNWSLKTSKSYIETNLEKGTLIAGDSILIDAVIDRKELETNSYDSEIIIDNGTTQIPVTVKTNHFIEKKWLINGRVVDAEYDRNNDVIIAVFDGPDYIKKLNVKTRTIDSLKLVLPGKCVSISKDGNYAVVGHNGLFSYINLKTMSLEKTYKVTANTFDIILAPNKWVYVFPEEDQHTEIRSINLENDKENLSYGIYEKTKVKLHPSGNYIYGADTGLAPSDFEKYDISSGQASYLYDSPYHGDYDFSGNIWISDDGNRLFAKSRNVFNSSLNKDNDMTYNGKLEGEGSVVTLDYSTKAEKVFAIFTKGDSYEDMGNNEVRMYESTYLGFKGVSKLPDFLIPDGKGGGQIFMSEGYFGFFNSEGTQFYTLVKAENGTGSLNEWAISITDVK